MTADPSAPASAVAERRPPRSCTGSQRSRTDRCGRDGPPRAGGRGCAQKGASTGRRSEERWPGRCAARYRAPRSTRCARHYWVEPVRLRAAGARTTGNGLGFGDKEDPGLRARTRARRRQSRGRGARQELKIGVKSHSSSIDEPSADRVRRLADSRGLKREPVPPSPSRNPSRSRRPRRPLRSRSRPSRRRRARRPAPAVDVPEPIAARAEPAPAERSAPHRVVRSGGAPPPPPRPVAPEADRPAAAPSAPTPIAPSPIAPAERPLTERPAAAAAGAADNRIGTHRRAR